MTELQQALLDRVHAVLAARTDGPTTEEVQRDFRYRYEGSVQRALEGLAEAGHLVRAHGRWQLPTPAVQLSLFPGGDHPRPAGLPAR